MRRRAEPIYMTSERLKFVLVLVPPEIVTS